MKRRSTIGRLFLSLEIVLISLIDDFQRREQISFSTQSTSSSRDAERGRSNVSVPRSVLLAKRRLNEFYFLLLFHGWSPWSFIFLDTANPSSSSILFARWNDSYNYELFNVLIQLWLPWPRLWVWRRGSRNAKVESKWKMFERFFGKKNENQALTQEV